MLTTEQIAFTVHGYPKAQPRPRGTLRGSKVHVYNPDSADDWKALIIDAAMKYQPQDPIEGPIEVNADFYFQRPTKHYFVRKDGNVLRPDVPALHYVKPDRDNLEKALLDALTLCRYWLDDCQVCAGEVRKLWGGVHHTQGPGVVVRVRELDP